MVRTDSTTDKLGNRTALTVDGQVTTYAYAPDSNRLATVDDGTGPVSFAYDAAGNTLTDGRRTFSYDARNRMTTADGYAYGYNALGQRAFKPRFQTAAPGDADGDGVIDQNDLLALRDMIKGKIPASPGADCNGDGAVDNQDTNCIARQIGATKSQGKGKNSDTETETVTTAATNGALTQVGWILFAYDEAGRLIGEYDEAGNPIRRYVWLEDLPLAVISAEGIHYLHADHLNTPKVVTDPQGAIVWQADYQPFGEVTEVVANTEMNLRFPGQYHDRETNLYQNWHREYVPELGRYSQSDPIGLIGGINRYGYALQNPQRYTDVNGLASEVVERYIRCAMSSNVSACMKEITENVVEQHVRAYPIVVSGIVRGAAECAQCAVTCIVTAFVGEDAQQIATSLYTEYAKQRLDQTLRAVAQDARRVGFKKLFKYTIPAVTAIQVVGDSANAIECTIDCT